MAEYGGRLPLYHFDAYLAEKERRFLAAGGLEYFHGAGASLVEWADRIAEDLPEDRLLVRFEILGETEREISFEAGGPRSAALLRDLGGGSVEGSGAPPDSSPSREPTGGGARSGREPMSGGPAPDDPLLRFRGGDARAFEELVRAYGDRLVKFFRRLGADAETSEDLTQEVFLKMLRGAFEYEGRGRFDAFVFRVARNAWVDHVRAIRARPRARPLEREGVRGGLPIPDGAPGPDARAGEREDSDRLLEGLCRLSEGERLVVELGLFQGLSYAEIATVLEIPVGTVKSRMFAAVRRLRREWEERP
jgi:RNA polymerase sigma-70 factor (ECF subfamily)